MNKKQIRVTHEIHLIKKEGKHMIRTISFVMLIGCLMLFVVPGVAQNKYVGTKICAPCHKMESTGKQFDIWQKTAHATAYKTLTTHAADSIAKAKGLKKSAVESQECLKCHVLQADAASIDKTFDMKDGVQCEVCHGAGSSYKSMATMKDHAKAVAAGLKEYKDDAAIQKLCVTCHNDQSPTHKEFKLKDMWDKIKHPMPKKS